MEYRLLYVMADPMPCAPLPPVGIGRSASMNSPDSCSARVVTVTMPSA